jgi:hypothetical protein
LYAASVGGGVAGVPVAVAATDAGGALQALLDGSGGDAVRVTLCAPFVMNLSAPLLVSSAFALACSVASQPQACVVDGGHATQLFQVTAGAVSFDGLALLARRAATAVPRAPLSRAAGPAPARLAPRTATRPTAPLPAPGSSRAAPST